MNEEKDLLNLLIDKVECEIIQCKDSIKYAKHDIKKLLKSKDGAIEAGIDDFVFEDKINYLNDIKEKLENRIYKLKKIKYRLDIAKKMIEDLN